MDRPTEISISRRRVLQLGIAGAVGAALPAAGCGEASPAAPSTYASSAITTTGGSGMPDATFVRIPANPSFAFASGSGAEPILTDYCLGVNLVTNDDYRGRRCHSVAHIERWRQRLDRSRDALGVRLHGPLRRARRRRRLHDARRLLSIRTLCLRLHGHGGQRLGVDLEPRHGHEWRRVGTTRQRRAWRVVVRRRVELSRDGARRGPFRHRRVSLGGVQSRREPAKLIGR